jgi:hypothetical protein
MVQPAKNRHFHTLCIEKPLEILLNRVFSKENTTSSLRESSYPLFLQESRPLTSLEATFRSTSLTVIGMKKIMCNTSIKENYKKIWRRKSKVQKKKNDEDIALEIDKIDNKRMMGEVSDKVYENHSYAYKWISIKKIKLL